MKLSSRIPLVTFSAGADGNPVPDSRSVADEIKRLRNMGCLDAADRLESSCDDTKLDTGLYVEVDPTNSEPFAADEIPDAPVPAKEFIRKKSVR